jgi:hypothetical protein
MSARGALLIELCASALTIAGIYLGSTTTHGALCYAASLVFWLWLMAVKRLWGLLPLNVALATVTAFNLLHGVHP